MHAYISLFLDLSTVLILLLIFNTSVQIPLTILLIKFHCVHNVFGYYIIIIIILGPATEIIAIHYCIYYYHPRSCWRSRNHTCITIFIIILLVLLQVQKSQLHYHLVTRLHHLSLLQPRTWLQWHCLHCPQQAVIWRVTMDGQM